MPSEREELLLAPSPSPPSMERAPSLAASTAPEVYYADKSVESAASHAQGDSTATLGSTREEGDDEDDDASSPAIVKIYNGGYGGFLDNQSQIKRETGEYGSGERYEASSPSRHLIHEKLAIPALNTTAPAPAVTPEPEHDPQPSVVGKNEPESLSTHVSHSTVLSDSLPHSDSPQAVATLTSQAAGGYSNRTACSASPIVSPSKESTKFSPSAGFSPTKTALESVEEGQVGTAMTAVATTPKSATGNATPNKTPPPQHADDDDDSSADDSSYFADPSNLPSPKSNRRFSFSSNHSASAPVKPAAPNHHHHHRRTGSSIHSRDQNRESDASLSFSDDSGDDDAMPPSHQQHPPHRRAHPPPQPPPILHPQLHPSGVPEIFPHQITRIHSVSSLVSTSSHGSSGSDSIVQDELKSMTHDALFNRGGTGVPSGRISPILGEHPPSRGPYYSFSSPSSVNAGPSPPPNILPGYQQHLVQHGYAHPQPHPQHAKPRPGGVVSAGVGGSNRTSNSTSDVTKTTTASSPGGQSPAWMIAAQTAQRQQQGPFARALPPSLGYPPNMGPHSIPRDASMWSRDSLAYSEDSIHGGSSSLGLSPHMTKAAGLLATATAGGTGSGLNNSSAGGAGRHLHGSNSFGGGSGHGSTGASQGAGSGAGLDSIGGPGGRSKHQETSSEIVGRGKATSAASGKNNGESYGDDTPRREKGFKVYWQRWLMLMYMSILNLLSDWTCYSVAPIPILTQQAFGNVDPEQLVTVFLAANAVASACEPIILSRLGLRKTILFGSLLLMIGSIIKSGSLPPIFDPDFDKGTGAWRVYLGFLFVGLSQPLYQCTPALLSASWFPERERTMATGVALNSNQVGIGFAFIFGTLLVSSDNDVPSYFGLLSILSTVVFFGALFQLDDAPPTPPSDTARVMRGTLEVNLPSIQTIVDTVRSTLNIDPNQGKRSSSKKKAAHAISSGDDSGRRGHGSKKKSSSARKTPRVAPSPRDRGPVGHRRKDGKAQRPTAPGPETRNVSGFHGLAPSPAPGDFPTLLRNYGRIGFDYTTYPAPSPMVPGPVAVAADEDGGGTEREGHPDDLPYRGYPPYPPYSPYPYAMAGPPTQPYVPPPGYPGYSFTPDMNPVESSGLAHYPGAPPYQGFPPYSPPFWDPHMQQQMQYYAYYHQQSPYQQPFYPPRQPMIEPDPYYYSYQHPPPLLHTLGYQSARAVLPSPEAIDEGAEPVLTLTPHHLDIDIRDDQVLLSIRACMARPGFIHALVSFTVSGIVINTLSTFMDHLVRLNGAGRIYTGIVGGTFQFVIMISSLIIGGFTDKTRAYYSVTIGMLVLGAFGLAECGVSLDADRGSDLRWCLVFVAGLVGPLQPVATELGVEVVYPLSENTVLVIQQLFSNLLSAFFIPCFKALKDVGRSSVTVKKKPEYTFSFYLLVVLHAAATVFFGTFNGRYLRHEHELAKASEEERKQEEETAAFHPLYAGQQYGSFHSFPSQQSQSASQSVDANEYESLTPHVV